MAMKPSPLVTKAVSFGHRVIHANYIVTHAENMIHAVHYGWFPFGVTIIWPRKLTDLMLIVSCDLKNEFHLPLKTSWSFFLEPKTSWKSKNCMNWTPFSLPPPRLKRNLCLCEFTTKESCSPLQLRHSSPENASFFLHNNNDNRSHSLGVWHHGLIYGTIASVCMWGNTLAFWGIGTTMEPSGSCTFAAGTKAFAETMANVTAAHDGLEHNAACWSRNQNLSFEESLWMAQQRRDSTAVPLCWSRRWWVGTASWPNGEMSTIGFRIGFVTTYALLFFHKCSFFTHQSGLNQLGILSRCFAPVV